MEDPTSMNHLPENDLRKALELAIGAKYLGKPFMINEIGNSVVVLEKVKEVINICKSLRGIVEGCAHPLNINGNFADLDKKFENGLPEDIKKELRRQLILLNEHVKPIKKADFNLTEQLPIDHHSDPGRILKRIDEREDVRPSELLPIYNTAGAILDLFELAKNNLEKNS